MQAEAGEAEGIHRVGPGEQVHASAMHHADNVQMPAVHPSCQSEVFRCLAPEAPIRAGLPEGRDLGWQIPEPGITSEVWIIEMSNAAQDGQGWALPSPHIGRSRQTGASAFPS